MLGCYDFCGHYEFTFQWLESQGGYPLLKAYWVEAIGQDSQIHAKELIVGEGASGMMKYWGHTLAEESPDQGYFMTRKGDVVRSDIHDCPSKGFLLRNKLEQFRDYCDHCIGWIGPIMKQAGYVVHHEHNHQGQCWWEFHPAQSKQSLPSGPPSDPQDVRQLPQWNEKTQKIDRWCSARDVDEKQVE